MSKKKLIFVTIFFNVVKSHDNGQIFFHFDAHTFLYFEFERNQLSDLTK